MAGAPRVLVQVEKRTQTTAILFSGAAIALLAPVAGRQLGLIAHLPDPPGQFWNSDRITSSSAAYPFGVPDALLGMASFGVTTALLVYARCSPIARKLLPWKLAGDAGAAAFNAGRQIVEFRRLCSWCMGAALAAAGGVYFGFRSLRSQNHIDAR